MKWLAIDNQYAVSEDGDVMNTRLGRILKPLDDRRGYLRIDLYNRHKKIHRLVADRFLPAPTAEGLVVDHIDRNRLNNSASNLRWVSSKENRLNSGICQKCYIASLVA